MKKLISFKTLKSICAFEYPNQPYISDCDHHANSEGKPCCAKNCPVWKKGEECKTTK